MAVERKKCDTFSANLGTVMKVKVHIITAYPSAPAILVGLLDPSR
jgi:hypothetical protein